VIDLEEHRGALFGIAYRMPGRGPKGRGGKGAGVNGSPDYRSENLHQILHQTSSRGVASGVTDTRLSAPNLAPSGSMDSDGSSILPPSPSGTPTTTT
jgi:hypothetical protein